MSTTWGPAAGAALRAYVLQHAANADAGLQRVADISRATGTKPSVYSKWFAGTEQPSVSSLEKLAPVIKAPLPELLVLACRVRAEDLGMESAPEAPEVLGHPLARELDAMLAEDSPLTAAERSEIEGFFDRYLEPYRRAMKTKSRRRAS
ncbi:helix-turn-helix domain-containing protein [Micromonospora tarensis]|uniref:Helix-turn-helix transcriptional regulator n=1 Tax=Micromonospora tarensis TaxID=2806100 RepID=A0ABS1YD70_9ACTN|nr:helix-turn-helix transcriptional regulator [Micromonospora tarensis]MBM0275366.1 helix-turn-helix transcriptional regulator [Micromonospora tarensis]